MNLGDKILKLRKEKNLSQEDLAEIVGVTRQTISNWELGETSPNYEQLKLLAESLSVDVDMLTKKDDKVSSTNELKNLKRKNIIILVMSFIIIILLVILLIIFLDSKNYIKLYKTTKNYNTTTGITSKSHYKNQTFIRTYKIEDINKVNCLPDINGCDDTTFDVVLSQYKGEKVKLQLSNSEFLKKLEKNKTYEFEFKMPGEIAIEKDNIQSIFAFAIIVSINETDKVGVDQIQEPIAY